MAEFRSIIQSTIDEANSELRKVNQTVHDNPELGYMEFIAHETITNFLEKQGFSVSRRAYGLDTSFECEVGQGGRLVIICAEYDALPDIGHGCGHNLIATSSIGAFLAAAKVIQTKGFPGRLRLLGTPAEEGLAGKVKLIERGAFPIEASAAIMAHPMPSDHFIANGKSYQGFAGLELLATHKFRVEYHGRTAHAACDPWNGINAVDAAVAGYQNAAMLRQHIEADDRVHGVFESGGSVPNVVPEYSRMNWYIRSPTKARLDELVTRIKACLEAGALATGCTATFLP
jgi:amidohydrolase